MFIQLASGNILKQFTNGFATYTHTKEAMKITSKIEITV